jgi:hypothetical protein
MSHPPLRLNFSHVLKPPQLPHGSACDTTKTIPDHPSPSPSPGYVSVGGSTKVIPCISRYPPGYSPPSSRGAAEGGKGCRCTVDMRIHCETQSQSSDSIALGHWRCGIYSPPSSRGVAEGGKGCTGWAALSLHTVVAHCRHALHCPQKKLSQSSDSIALHGAMIGHWRCGMYTRTPRGTWS